MSQPRGRNPLMTPPGNDPTRTNPQRPRISGWGWVAIIVVMVAFNLWFYANEIPKTANGPQLTAKYSTFISQVRADNVKTATVTSSDVTGDFVTPYRDSSTGKSYPRYTTTVRPELISQLVSQLNAHRAQVTIANESTPLWVNLLTVLLNLVPFLFLIGLFYIGSRSARQQQQGIFGFGQSNAKLYTEERPSTTFADVAGVDTAKAELREIVDFLKEPSKYYRLGARIPKGALLVGPPGTGKTLLARAVAGEAKVAFFSISSTEFVEMFVGVGASRVRDLFDRARKAAPAIVFVDEIDAIGGQRGGRGPVSGVNDEREQTLNQLLVSMDGFEANEAVIILAATNRPDVLDPALLRPGRFDRQIPVDLPDRKGRDAILRVHTRHIPLAPDVDFEGLAQATPGMSGADLANLANEAALGAARRGAQQVNRRDFDEALDRITLGPEGAPLMNQEERRVVAYHEGGHSLVALMLPNVDPVHRVTITPRGRSLGVTQFRPIDDRRNYRRDYLVNRMAVGLGGRSAEEIVFDDITSGAQNDIQQVTNVARAMVTQLGMADDLGPTYFGGAGDDALNGRVGNPWEPKEYSEETAERIDAAVQRLVTEAHIRARTILTENRDALDAVAEALLHEESLTRDALTDIANQHRPPGRPPLQIPTGEPTPIGEGMIEPSAVTSTSDGSGQ